MSTSTRTKAPNWAEHYRRNGHVYVRFDRFSLRHQRGQLAEVGFEWQEEQNVWRALATDGALETAEKLVVENNAYWTKRLAQEETGEQKPRETRKPQSRNGNGKNPGSYQDPEEFLPFVKALLEGVTITKGDLKEALREVLREEGMIAARSF
ncbi:MAG: hypothetical protein V3T26_05980 [candidate division NC10 bacterium]